MSEEKLKPGDETPTSGQYEVIGPDGEDKDREVTSVKGNPLPPGQEAGTRYELVDETKHKEN